MEKEMIIKTLKERGFRITKQRLMILDIILEEDCSCCKEIYYKASKREEGIGTATVYRMINTLEEIGALNRGNMYKITRESANKCMEQCRIELEDSTTIELSPKKWKQIVESGLKACGYQIGQNNIRSVTC